MTCGGLNVDHEEYAAVCIKKHRLSKNTFKYVEQEIRQYKNNLKELNRLKNDIIQETPEKQNGRSSGLGDSYTNAGLAYKLGVDERTIRRCPFWDVLKV